MGICCSLPIPYVGVQWAYVVLCPNAIWIFNDHILFFPYALYGCSLGRFSCLPTPDVDWLTIIRVASPQSVPIHLTGSPYWNPNSKGQSLHMSEPATNQRPDSL